MRLGSPVPEPGVARLVRAVVFCGLAAAATTGCVFSEYDEDTPPLTISMVVPSEATIFEISAFEDSSCDANGQFHLGGTVLDDVSRLRFDIGVIRTLMVPIGTYIFEVIAIDASETAELRLAAGCAPATIRVKQTTNLRLELVAIDE